MGLNPALARINSRLREADSEYFIVSDPDLEMNPYLPLTWQDDVVAVAKETNAAKVSFVINTDIGACPERLRNTIDVEKRYLNNPVAVAAVHAPCYWAAVDTAFALMRRDTYKEWEAGLQITKNMLLRGLYMPWAYNKKYKPPVRVGGDYTMNHMGWALHPGHEYEMNVYRILSDARYSSALRCLGS